MYTATISVNSGVCTIRSYMRKMTTSRIVISMGGRCRRPKHVSSFRFSTISLPAVLFRSITTSSSVTIVFFISYLMLNE